ncbi:hypothetical protein [Flavobacterium sp. C3NV]|uniref:GAP1-N1 domain-containing protein n=1 Tax=Flavobacterium sp. C3NV TaxID=3393358 RepID=UPI00398F9E30
MKIQIEQTLHGYQNGHQLLMSSSSLSNDAKKTLLVQSDLSGSNIDEGFKIYITGYPLATHFAFSKTWYADEMKRPGCVWTQTLLIQFSDLGKIPDLDQLLQYFKRPVKDEYADYSFPILIDKENLRNSNYYFDDLTKALPLLNAIYSNYDKTIILPAFNTLEYEKIVVQIWSNQWPRLRRNFSFCTGALNLKVIDGQEFDFQVVPVRNIGSIEKQSINSYIYSDEFEQSNNWSKLFPESSKNSLRKFLWFYGSDVKGLRKNYQPLLELFKFSGIENLSFSLVSTLLSNVFDKDEGALIKKEIYNVGTLFSFAEREILNYLISNSDVAASQDIGERLVKALKDNKINIDEFVEFYLKAGTETLNPEVWESISIQPLDIINLIARDNRMISVFNNEIPFICSISKIWELPFETQLILFGELEKSNDVNWESIIQAILESKSSILFHLLRNNDQRIYFLIQTCNKSDFRNVSDEIVALIFNNKTVLKDFIRKNCNSLSGKFCNKIFQNLNYYHLYSIGLDFSQWKVIYNKINDEQIKVFASCALLSFAFNRKILTPAPLAAECFDDVYNFAKNSKIHYETWQILPIDAVEQDDDDAFYAFFSFFFSPKKADVPSWDYCELIIRTLVNKFIKFRWPLQFFLDSLKTFETTQSAFSYALGFKKGRRFLKEIIINGDKGKLKFRSCQIELIKFLKEEL